jgi:hypothetical protein
MLKAVLLLSLITLLSSLVCVEVEPSYLASASNCTISKLDDNTIKWSAVLTFQGDVSHRADNWFNLLADMEHPRLPYFPTGSECTSQFGTYYNGQSATITCTQSF